MAVASHPPARTRTCRNYCIRFLPRIDASRHDAGRRCENAARVHHTAPGARFPCSGQARVRHHSVLLGHRPSLHRLRRQYRNRPCSAASSVLCRCSTPRPRACPDCAFGFPGRPDSLLRPSDVGEVSRFSRVQFLDVRTALGLRRACRKLAMSFPSVWPSRWKHSVGARYSFFEARFLARRCLCLHFTRRLAAPSARLEVKMVRYSFLVGLFHPRLHAGLSRRLRFLTVAALPDS
jgi:hypothetical protein